MPFICTPFLPCRITTFFLTSRPSFFRAILSQAHTITCNSAAVFNSTYMLGSGAPLSVYSAWGDFYGTTDFKIKFYATSSPLGKTDMANRMHLTENEKHFILAIDDAFFLHKGDIDFAATTAYPTTQEFLALKDVKAIPGTLYATVPAYNVSYFFNRPFFQTSFKRDVFMNCDAGSRTGRKRAFDLDYSTYFRHLSGICSLLERFGNCLSQPSLEGLLAQQASACCLRARVLCCRWKNIKSPRDYP